MASACTTSTDFLVNGKYRLVRKIGSGSFGDIYLGINISNGEVCIPVSRLQSLTIIRYRYGKYVLLMKHFLVF